MYFIIKGPKVPMNTFWRLVLGHSVLLILINLQVGLSTDRFWAICHPFSYLRSNAPKRRNVIIIMSVASAVLIGFGSGFYVCVIEPRLDPLDLNSIFNCTISHDFRTSFKGFFGMYASAAIVTIIGLNSFVIHRLLQRVSSVLISKLTFIKLFNCRERIWKTCSRTMPRMRLALMRR
jgi:hypothetical protein